MFRHSMYSVDEDAGPAQPVPTVEDGNDVARATHD